ncbi:transcriptional regulator [Nocardiopsis kunsanensis]|uniref:Transcriptional regulator n=1 Tax=Nocardiopsis kunsanensis TaxID=141693 RepID=A0A918XE38_9ACTN|nr:transcriptional regulator [Nocardiopsis kunsanensis]GHD28410.1 transcriptional regulator [Nocardiopsis kunsanensis]
MAESAPSPSERPDNHMDVDATALRGLAHPLRGRLLEQLQLRGPATATILGKRLEESSGSTSYHLRQLARHGFIEPAEGHGGGRERWWQARRGGWSMSGHAFRQDPATRHAADTVLEYYYGERERRFRTWNDLAASAPEDPDVQRWKAATMDANHPLPLTPEEAQKLSRDLMDFMWRWKREHVPESRESAADTPGTETVEVQINLFPVLARLLEPEAGQGPEEGSSGPRA